MPPKNFSSSPQFRWLCSELLEKIHDAALRKKSIGKPLTIRYLEIITNFIRLWRATVGNDIYPALRLILPYRDRRMYNIKDTTLIKALCRFLKLPKNCDTEIRLLHWKQRAAKGSKLSDFCVEEISKRQKEYEGKRRITINELNKFLDDISNGGNGRGVGYVSLDESPAFIYCLRHMSFIEMKFFFDILLKTRVINGLDHKFLNAWHPDANDYLSVVSNLKILCQRLYDPNERLDQGELTINISHAFEPQLAKRVYSSYDSVASTLDNDFLIEEKMDGERIQVHYKDYGNEIKFFSRRGVDFSYLYGNNIKNGPISANLCLHPNVKECILDGEMITYDLERDIVLPFGLVKSSAFDGVQSEMTGHSNNSSFRPLLMVFDLVFLNGKPLVQLRLSTRKKYLHQILTPKMHTVELIPYTKASSGESIRLSLEHAISVGSEGIILKRENSCYSIGSRNSDWVKIKPEYLENFGENMDLLVLGRDPGKKDKFICGLSIFDPACLDAKPKFISFCTIANGFSEKEYKDLEIKTSGKWINYSEHSPPISVLEFGSKTPYEWINPEDSIVLEVKARAVCNRNSDNKKYKSGCTLHFAYCKQIRYDKNWENVTSLTEFEEMMESRNCFNKKRNQLHSSPGKRRSKRTKIALLNSLSPSKVEHPSTFLFQNLKFKTLSDYFDRPTKKRKEQQDLNALILDHGGEMVYSDISKNNSEYADVVVISDIFTRECKKLFQQGFTIFRPLWIIRCIEAKSIVPLDEKYLLMGHDIPECLQSRMFSKTFSSQDFNIMMGKSNKDRLKFDSSTDLMDIPIFMFSHLKLGISNMNSIPSLLIKDLNFKIRSHGGIIVPCDEADMILVFTDFQFRGQLTELRKAIAKKAISESIDGTARIPRIIDVNWINVSINSAKYLDPEPFQVFEPK